MSTATYQPDPNQPSFCQVCGRSVASEADRLAGNAFHCGLCNEVRLASPASTGFGGGGTGAAAGGAAVPPVAGPGSGAGIPGGIPPFPPFAVPPQVPGSAGMPASPGLAALLGLIPGVGAMYNGQYAKGVVHLIVFAILVSLADSHDVFGLFVAGWIFYQAIEAYHTARARRDGTPLPNPFGLNDIGERFGFGKAWSGGSAAAPGVPFAGAQAPPGAGAVQFVPPAPNWGASSSNVGAQASWGAGQGVQPYPPGVPPYPGYATPFGYGSQVPPPSHVPVFDGQEFAPGYSPFGHPQAGFDPVYPSTFPSPRNRFPAGAIWLIGLGTLFLVNTSSMFRWVNFHLLLPIFFLGLGVWTFVHKMTDGGLGLADDGTPGYRVRLFRAARGSVWLILLGVIFFLADFDILPWSRSWPLFLILAGVMTFLERAVYSSARAEDYGYPPAGAPPFSSPVTAAGATKPTVAETAIADPTMPNQEGR